MNDVVIEGRVVRVEESMCDYVDIQDDRWCSMLIQELLKFEGQRVRVTIMPIPDKEFSKLEALSINGAGSGAMGVTPPLVVLEVVKPTRLEIDSTAGHIGSAEAMRAEGYPFREMSVGIGS